MTDLLRLKKILSDAKSGDDPQAILFLREIVVAFAYKRSDKDIIRITELIIQMEEEND